MQDGKHTIAEFEFSHQPDIESPKPWWKTLEGEDDFSQSQKDAWDLKQKLLHPLPAITPQTLAGCTVVDGAPAPTFKYCCIANGDDDDDDNDDDDDDDDRDCDTGTAIQIHEKLLQRRPLARRPDSAETSSLVRSWIDNCMANHPLCNFSFTHVPTRLLDVSDSERSGYLRLVKTSGDKDSYRSYVTRSHCWGTLPDEQKRELTSTWSLAQKTGSVLLQSLPRSFRDAVQITGSVGERFLWIDGLCIVQGSPTDWEKESAVMGLIYRNAVCTIVAAEASNSNEGVFHSRHNVPTSITIATPAEESYNGKQIFVHPIFPEWAATVPSTPLATRAWTLQERQLSRRLVQYTKNQVFWECASSSASESAPLQGLGPGTGETDVPSFGQKTGPGSQRLWQTIASTRAAMTPEEELEFRREYGDVNPSSPEDFFDEAKQQLADLKRTGLLSSRPNAKDLEMIDAEKYGKRVITIV